MSGWNRLSIRGKLFSVILLILAANVAVLLCAGSTLFERFYVNSKVASLTNSAFRIRDAYNQNSGTIYDEINEIENQNTIVNLVEVGSDGKTFRTTYHSRAERKGMQLENRPDMPPPGKEDENRFQREMQIWINKLEDGEEYKVMMLGESDSLKDQMISLYMRLNDDLYLTMFTPRGYIKSSADLAVKYTAVLSISILVLGAAAIYFLVGRITKPIRAMQRAADKISGLDFSETCEVNGGDELARLSQSINNMSARLQASIQTLVEANEVLQNDLVRQQQTDRMRREFVASVSHDFKTPLTLMISYAEALMNDCPEGQLREYGETILTEGNKLSGMVGRLLNLSKLESGADALEVSIFCLDELVDGVLKPIRVLMEKKKLTLESRLESGLIVSADYAKIEQVVSNLVDNAVKYAPQGGVVRVLAARSGAVCRVAVENTGTPIAKTDLEHLFDSFYRADKSRKADGQSYGLGLAIVRAAMQAHGMPYGVENLEDGVRFWFEVERWADDGEEDADQPDGEPETE